jgi:hypothetical protein
VKLSRGGKTFFSGIFENNIEIKHINQAVTNLFDRRHPLGSPGSNIEVPFYGNADRLDTEGFIGRDNPDNDKRPGW